MLVAYNIIEIMKIKPTHRPLLFPFIKKEKVLICTRTTKNSATISSYYSIYKAVLFKKSTCICPVINHELCHDFVNVAVDPQGNSQVNLQTTVTMLHTCMFVGQNSLSITG